MLQDLGWRDLAQRRVDNTLSVMYRITRDLLDVHLRNIIRLQRNEVNIKPIIARTTYYKFSFFPRTISDCNNLEQSSLTGANVADTFKRRYHNWSMTYHNNNYDYFCF